MLLLLVLGHLAIPLSAQKHDLTQITTQTFQRVASQHAQIPYKLPPLSNSFITELCTAEAHTNAMVDGETWSSTLQTQRRYFNTSGSQHITAEESGTSPQKFLQYFDKRTHQYLRQYESQPLRTKVLEECGPLNRSGVVVVLSGPPGAGKSALLTLALHYGYDGHETEQGTKTGNCNAKVEECTRLRRMVGNMDPCKKLDACNSIWTRTNVFEPLVRDVDHFLIIGGGGIYQPRQNCAAAKKSFGAKLANKIPPEMVSVVMAPDIGILEGERIHHTEQQRNSTYAAAQTSECQELFDTVITNSGCEHSGLLEVCRAVRTYLQLEEDGFGSSSDRLFADQLQEQRRQQAIQFYEHKRLALMS